MNIISYPFYQCRNSSLLHEWLYLFQLKYSLFYYFNRATLFIFSSIFLLIIIIISLAKTLCWGNISLIEHLSWILSCFSFFDFKLKSILEAGCILSIPYTWLCVRLVYENKVIIYSFLIWSTPVRLLAWYLWVFPLTYNKFSSNTYLQIIFRYLTLYIDFVPEF